MIIQLENVILISRNSETVLFLLLLLDYFGARTNFALGYPLARLLETKENRKIGEPLPEERNCSPPKQTLDKGKTHEENFQITITTAQIHN